MPLIAVALAAVGLVGHGLIVVGYVNRLHALPLRRRWLKILEAPVLFWGVIAPLALCVRLLDAYWPAGQIASDSVSGFLRMVDGYFAGAAIVLTLGLPFWLRDRWRPIPAALRSDEGQLIDIAARLGFRPAGNRATARWAAWPGNEIFQLDVRRKELAFARLPAALDGLRITHLSDLHMSGRIGVEFFEQVADEANALSSDVMVVTGDLFDGVAHLEWIPRTLARLRAPLGIYFLLGNHDWRLPDPAEARRRLTALGWVDLGGGTRVCSWRDVTVRLAGNEMPWFGPAPQWAVSRTPGATSLATDEFVVALLHTPDQIGWARTQRVDLALAGHTHGGQIRFPLIGAIVCPSLYGVRYAGGAFQEGDTLLHVSRGVSGLEPIRWRCPPEITQLTLRRAARP